MDEIQLSPPHLNEKRNAFSKIAFISGIQIQLVWKWIFISQ